MTQDTGMKWNKYPYYINPQAFTVIGIAGEAESGKGEIAELAKYGYDFSEEAFADAPKEAAKIIFDLSDEAVYTTKGKAKFNDYWGMTNRKLLQLFPSDAMKPVFGRDIWVRRLHLSLFNLYTHTEVRRVVISDLRFPEEVEYIVHELGGDIIFVHRPQHSTSLTADEQMHENEVSLRIDNISAMTNNKAYIVMNNGSLEEMRGVAANALTQIINLKKY